MCACSVRTICVYVASLRREAVERGQVERGSARAVDVARVRDVTLRQRLRGRARQEERQHDVGRPDVSAWPG